MHGNQYATATIALAIALSGGTVHAGNAAEPGRVVTELPTILRLLALPTTVVKSCLPLPSLVKHQQTSSLVAVLLPFSLLAIMFR